MAQILYLEKKRTILTFSDYLMVLICLQMDANIHTVLFVPL